MSSSQHKKASAVISGRRIVVYAVLASFSVFVVALLTQWLIYDDWLHETGPLRIVGTAMASVLTLWFVSAWLIRLRRGQQETLARFDRIAAMNDRIRNALQAIECLAFASTSEPIEGIRQAVNTIEDELSGVVEESRPLRVPVAAEKASENQVKRQRA
jgi:ABC-type multidrug transport system fused ATPase/permease subunit